MTSILTAREAAKHLNCSYIYLAQLRQRGTGPVYYKMGSFVKYRQPDLDAWLDARAVNPSGIQPARKSA